MQLLTSGSINSARFASLSAVTTVGAGTAAAVPQYAGIALAPSLTWEVKLNGTAAAALQIDIQGSMDNINWFQIDTSAVTASGAYFISNKNVLFVRANVISITTPNGNYTVYIDVA